MRLNTAVCMKNCCKNQIDVFSFSKERKADAAVGYKKAENIIFIILWTLCAVFLSMDHSLQWEKLEYVSNGWKCWTLSEGLICNLTCLCLKEMQLKFNFKCNTTNVQYNECTTTKIANNSLGWHYSKPKPLSKCVNSDRRKTLPKS